MLFKEAQLRNGLPHDTVYRIYPLKDDNGENVTGYELYAESDLKEEADRIKQVLFPSWYSVIDKQDAVTETSFMYDADILGSWCDMTNYYG